MSRFPVKSFEDALLHALWKQRGRRGWWLLEVPIGSGRARRLDALVVHDAQPRVSPEGEDLHELAKAIDGAVVEVIEAKKHLNVDVIGQVLAGTTMLSEAHPGHGPMLATAVVQHASDDALRWFCNRERIAVLETQPDWDGKQAT